MKYYLLIFILSISSVLSYGNDSIAAFPGAEGFGANTPGGRGGKVVIVSNLNDSGPGSLRNAISLKEPRIITFSTGGIINLETPINVLNPYLTIAGQSATGDGICIRGNGINILSHDIIIRHLRIRPGDINFGPINDWGNLDAISIGNSKTENVYNIIIDHCSLSWGVDENLGINGTAHNITIQNCIISEALNSNFHPKGPHSKGLLINGKATNISIHHNLFAHNNERNPLLSGEGFVDFRNNIIYNPGGQISGIIFFGRKPKFQHLNYIGNYIKYGANKQEKWEITVRQESKYRAKIYIEDNLGPNNLKPENDNWRMVRFGDTGDLLPLEQNVDVPFKHPYITTYKSIDLVSKLLPNVGATLPIRDPVDRKVIDDFNRNKGRIISHKQGFLEWPPLNIGLPFLDTDKDGIPDHWEEKFNLNETVDTDNNLDFDNDGYTNIEEYLNQTDPFSSSNFLVESFQTNARFPKLQLKLQQNYPNPFEDSTNIKFEIGEPSSTTIKILNSNGNIVDELVNGFLYEGKYEVEIDTKNFDTGIYYLVLQTNNSNKTIKMVCLK